MDVLKREKMKIVDDKLLQTFREKTICEYCGKTFRGGLDPHHLWAKGMGGGGRLDHKLNLIALCRKDHSASHGGGKPTFNELLEIVAKREGVTADYIRTEVFRMRRS